MADPSVARRRRLKPALYDTKKMVESGETMMNATRRTFVLIAAVACASSLVYGNVLVPFLEAATSADAVVLVRHVDSDSTHLRFQVLELYRGKKAPEFVSISRTLWPYVSQRWPESDLKGATFFLLLDPDGSLRCGHLGDLPILCGTCFGVIPVVQDFIPEAYRWSWDRGDSGKVPLSQAKAALVALKVGP